MSKQQKIYCNELVLDECARELGLTVNQVRKIVQSQSEYTKHIMESGTFDSVRWPFAGVFKSNPKEVQMLNHMKGMDEDQRKEFRKNVMTGKIKFNWWEQDDNRSNQTEESDSSNGTRPDNTNTTSD